jgi:hypothetical protein
MPPKGPASRLGLFASNEVSGFSPKIFAACSSPTGSSSVRSKTEK